MAAFTAGSYEELCETLKEIYNSKMNDTFLKNAARLADENHSPKRAKEVLKTTINSCTKRV